MLRHIMTFLFDRSRNTNSDNPVRLYKGCEGENNIESYGMQDVDLRVIPITDQLVFFRL